MEANDSCAMWMLASYYSNGEGGLQQDHAKAMALYARSADLGYSKVHFSLGHDCLLRGDMKKVKFHCEAGAISGNEVTRSNIGIIESNSGNVEQAVRCFCAMHHLITLYKKGFIIENQSTHL